MTLRLKSNQIAAALRIKKRFADLLYVATVVALSEAARRHGDFHGGTQHTTEHIDAETSKTS